MEIIELNKNNFDMDEDGVNHMDIEKVEIFGSTTLMTFISNGKRTEEEP